MEHSSKIYFFTDYELYGYICIYIYSVYMYIQSVYLYGKKNEMLMWLITDVSYL